MMADQDGTPRWHTMMAHHDGRMGPGGGVVPHPFSQGQVYHLNHDFKAIFVLSLPYLTNDDTVFSWVDHHHIAQTGL